MDKLSPQCSPLTRPLLVDSVLELVGKTPLVRLSRLEPQPNSRAEIYLKLESMNPSMSSSDRAGLALVEGAEQSGKLQKGKTIVAAADGSFGVSLAMVCASKGYPLIVTMPENISDGNRKMAHHYGAKTVLTPARKFMQGAIERASDIVKTNPHCFLFNQYTNPTNVQIHRETTAKEIVSALNGKIDAFVAGIGSGGTVTGVGTALKQVQPQTLIVGVEPSKSAVLHGNKAREHHIHGLGVGFVPESLDRAVVDTVVACREKEAYHWAQQLARQEGISAGLSTGAVIWAALEIAERLGPGKNLVMMLPDSWERYLSLDLNSILEESLNFVI